jgi:GNAT superfamily N-acetyltransferase
VSLGVREAVSDDAERLFEIQRETSLAAFAEIFPPDRHPFPDDDVRARWRVLLSRADSGVLLAERSSRTVGMVAFAPGRLVALYVVPDQWGRGVGSRLHDAAVAALRELGAEARLWVLADNRNARRFYERRGWQLDGRERVVPFPPHPLDVGFTLSLR